jgi:hypothetical protein
MHDTQFWGDIASRRRGFHKVQTRRCDLYRCIRRGFLVLYHT